VAERSAGGDGGDTPLKNRAMLSALDRLVRDRLLRGGVFAFGFANHLVQLHFELDQSPVGGLDPASNMRALSFYALNVLAVSAPFVAFKVLDFTIPALHALPKLRGDAPDVLNGD
jgi:hypothetical protein